MIAGVGMQEKRENLQIQRRRNRRSIRGQGGGAMRLALSAGQERRKTGKKPVK
jgi:hypothetical protein